MISHAPVKIPFSPLGRPFSNTHTCIFRRGRSHDGERDSWEAIISSVIVGIIILYRPGNLDFEVYRMNSFTMVESFIL